MNRGSTDAPHHRAIFAVDIEGSTTRNNTAKAGLRDAMYELVERALADSGITAEYLDPLVDRGDGILTLVRPVDEVPKTLLLSAVVPTLAELLAGYNESRRPDGRLRLRAVLHAGEVHHDGRAPFGEALDIAFRLLDAPEVKQAFRMCTGPLLLVVSDDIYKTIVRHGYDGIDERAFSLVADVLVAGQRHRGWVCLPNARSTTETPQLSDVYVKPAAAQRIVKAAHRFDERKHVV
jgi:hypothetical protein